MKKENFFYLLSFLIALVFYSSCATVSYSPKVSLDVSPEMIKKSLMVEKLKDVSPSPDKRNPFGGFSVTNNGALAGDLETEVTNAIITDFSNNGVFKQVSRKIEDPDIIMKGEIKKFTGKSSFTRFGKISLCTVAPIITWYFGIPIAKNNVDVDLTLSFFDKSGKLIGSYEGTYQYQTKYSMYQDKQLAVLNATNKGFSQVVGKIRNEIVADKAKF